MEKPTITVRIGKYDYPLWVNLEASIQLTEKYGGVVEAGKIIADVEGKSLSEILDIVADILITTTTQGIDYCRYMLDQDLDIEPLTKEMVRKLLRVSDLLYVRQKLFDAIDEGVARNIISEENDDDSKNSSDE